jgi:hypothetical protein
MYGLLGALVVGVAYIISKFVNQTFPSNKFPSFVFVNTGPHTPGSSKKERYY